MSEFTTLRNGTKFYKIDHAMYSLIGALGDHCSPDGEIYLQKWGAPFDATSWLPQMYPNCDVKRCYFFVSVLRNVDINPGRFVSEIKVARPDMFDCLWDDEAFDPAYNFVVKRLRAFGEIGFDKIKRNQSFWRDDFYNSKEWLELRYRAVECYGGRCMACGRSPRNGVIIHVDHIKPKFRYPEMALDFNNLQILCSDCNLGKSCDYTTNWKRGENRFEVTEIRHS